MVHAALGKVAHIEVAVIAQLLDGRLCFDLTARRQFTVKLLHGLRDVESNVWYGVICQKQNDLDELFVEAVFCHHVLKSVDKVDSLDSDHEPLVL